MKDARTAWRLMCLLLSGWAVLVIAALPDRAHADTRSVNCDRGQRISAMLRMPAGRQLTINVSGACTDNVDITRDDVTIQGNGTATLAPRDNTRPTINIDGGRRIVIRGLTITGGAGGVVGVNGSLFSVLGTPATPCVVQGGTRFGVLASWNSIGTIDGCTVQGVNADGVVASNSASIVITNSTVQNNTGHGIIAARNSHVRIGQNKNGDAVVHSVTITGNTQNGVSIVDSSAGIIVGGSITGHGTTTARRHGVFVGRGSSGHIGAGLNGVEAGVTIRSNTGDGISVEGGNVTVLGSTISQNRQGISLTNGATGRIGIRTDSSSYVGNEITGNESHGMTIMGGSNALLGGNNIHDNGTDTTITQRYGVVIMRSSATLIGGNTVSGHWNSGLLLWPGAVRIGDSSFGLDTANTISGNGVAGPAGATGGLAGIIVGLGGAADLRGAIVSGNVGAGISAYQGAVVDLRDGTAVTGNLLAGATGGHGIDATRNSTVRLRTASVTGNAGHGIVLTAGSGAQFDSASASVTGNTGFGLGCFAIGGAGQGATNYAGNVRGITGNAGGGNDDGTNASIGNIPDCTRF